MMGTVVLGVFSLLLSCQQLDVPLYDQTVEYKTACESVATVATLNYLGYDITIDEFLDNYLAVLDPWDEKVFNSEDNIFDHYFLGDPRTSQGWLCNPPVICSGVEQYFSDVGETELVAHDTSGVEFKSLLDEVAEGNPVILWVIGGYEPTEAREWKGNPFYAKSHTVVLSGYDKTLGVVHITDSVKGDLELEYEVVKNIYDFAGKHSVVIK